MIKDPAGLLERIPELTALCEDARVAKAVEGGDPFKVYRALIRAKWTGGLKAHRAELQTVLGNRRLFARPYQKRLFLGSYNGFGASLVGASEPDPRDGTSIATHALVVLFRLPVFPLGAYVVRPGSGGVMRRSWQVFARVPMGPLSWIYNRGVALALLLAVGGAAFHAFHASRNQDVQILNGFDAPVKVALADHALSIPAHGRQALEVPVGRYDAVATTSSGEALEKVALDVRAGTDVLAWNIAGSAPLYLERVPYASGDGKDLEDQHSVTLYCGESVVSLRNVDDAFRPSPQSADIPNGQQFVIRTHVDVAFAEMDHPATSCVNVALAKGHKDKAAQLAEALARVSNWNFDDVQLAEALVLRASPAKWLELAKAAHAAHPDDVRLARGYQDAMTENGQREAVAHEFQAEAAAHPDSSSAQYLAARLLEGKAGADAIEALAPRFPNDDFILRALAYNRYSRQDWKGAAEAWQTLHTRNIGLAAEVGEEGVSSLFASGDAKGALAAAKDLFDHGPAAKRDDAAALYARVAAHVPGANAAALVEKVEQEAATKEAPGTDPRDWALRARAGLPIDAAPAQDYALTKKLATDPSGAVELVKSSKDVDLYQVDSTGWMLLYAEAARVRDAKAVEQLRTRPIILPSVEQSFQAYVRGESVRLDPYDVPPDARAAADIVRARNPQLDAKERDRLMNEAQQLDPLHPLIQRAARTWKL